MKRGGQEGTTATTPQLLRRTNLSAVLQVLRSAGAVTGTDLIEATGLTRATVIAVCDDLVRLGWAREVGSQREPSGAQKGRPARRFEFNERAGCVLGIDVGAAKTTVLAADLKGEPLGRATAQFPALSAPVSERADTISSTVREALAAARLDPSDVLAAGIGVAAPVDRKGRILPVQEFWENFDIGMEATLRDRYGWPVLLANDANLAALAEHWRGAGAGVDDLAVMLAGERIGFGLLESGRLLHGSRGGAGEVGGLELVEGVGTPEGIASLARRWGAEALAGPEPTAIRQFAGNSGVRAEDVFRAAGHGDPVAQAILERISARMARVIALLATMFNPELVVIGGAVAGSAGSLLAAIDAALPRLTATPPRVAVSSLGDTIVSLGAVRLALDFVEHNALDLDVAAPVMKAQTAPA